MLNHLNVTMLIISCTCIISLICFSNRQLTNQLIFSSKALRKNQYHRLLTHGFIHADGNHLLFNMITLFFFGRYVENVYDGLLGGMGFIMFYIFAIISAIIPTYLAQKNNDNYYSLGASGAVSAVLFTYILIEPWSLLYLFLVIPIPAIIFAVAYTAYSLWAEKKANDNINHSAHIWGAVYGVVITVAIDPNLIIQFFKKLLNPSL